MRRLFRSWRQIPITSINCRGDGSPLISIVLGLADRSLVSLHINTVTGTVEQDIPSSHRQGYHSYRNIINHCRRGIHIAQTLSEDKLLFQPCLRRQSPYSLHVTKMYQYRLYAYNESTPGGDTSPLRLHPSSWPQVSSAAAAAAVSITPGALANHVGFHRDWTGRTT